MAKFINPFTDVGFKRYYLSHAIARQGEKGVKWQFDVKAVYGVFFMNFRLNDSKGELRTDVILANKVTNEPFSDKLRFTFLELPNFHKEENECENDFERWIYVLKNMDTLNRLPFKAQKSVFEKLEQITDIAALSKEDREKYDESIKVYRDNLAVMSYQKEEGIAIGRLEGRKEGKEEAQIANARRMIMKGYPIEEITDITGLSPDKVMQLREELN